MTKLSLRDKWSKPAFPQDIRIFILILVQMKVNYRSQRRARASVEQQLPLLIFVHAWRIALMGY